MGGKGGKGGRVAGQAEETTRRDKKDEGLWAHALGVTELSSCLNDLNKQKEALSLRRDAQEEVSTGHYTGSLSVKWASHACFDHHTALTSRLYMALIDVQPCIAAASLDRQFHPSPSLSYLSHI